jgi:BRCA1/BRCA2-containing complex subunit 3
MASSASATQVLLSSSVASVRMSDAVLRACLHHALLTEHEEMMGLLLGCTLPVASEPTQCKFSRSLVRSFARSRSHPLLLLFASCFSFVFLVPLYPLCVCVCVCVCVCLLVAVVEFVGVCLLRRSCQESDRVEISPEELASATMEAERFSVELQRHVRVLGWYHSHPHSMSCACFVCMCVFHIRVYMWEHMFTSVRACVRASTYT